MAPNATQKSYLYIISRADIPLAQQAVQASHAALEYAYQYGRPADMHPSLVHLTVKSQTCLIDLITCLTMHDPSVRIAEFHEPYKNWGLTAIACQLDSEHSARWLLKSLPLWRVFEQKKEIML